MKNEILNNNKQIRKFVADTVPMILMAERKFDLADEVAGLTFEQMKSHEETAELVEGLSDKKLQADLIAELNAQYVEAAEIVFGAPQMIKVA